MTPDQIMPRCECSEEEAWEEVESARSHLDATAVQVAEALRAYNEAEDIHADAMARWISVS